MAENLLIGIISLGCPKASSDTELILTRLQSEGYEICDGNNLENANNAALLIINTCGFVDAAIEESLDAIGEALQQNDKVIVTGCLGAEHHQQIIQKTYPNVLAVTGPHSCAEVMDLVHKFLPRPHEPFADLIPPQGVRLTPEHFAYLKISEGCNHDCSFCIIPKLRGKLVSRSLGEVMNEAELLVKSGVKEILVISQDTSAYGVDLKYRTGFYNGRPMKTRLKELCQALASLGVWVRLHYVYPYPNVDEILPLMAEGKILPYLDVPLQHASPKILKAMKRPAFIENTLQRICDWRKICPDLAIRSTFITGFPGETDADFDLLLQFLDEAKLDRVGCFAYSDVVGAVANNFADKVPEALAMERRDWLLENQAEISAEKLSQKIDSQLQILVDMVDEEGTIGRSKYDAPEVDGVVVLDNFFDANPGEFINAKIIDSDEHDLYAQKI
ncbi:MAG: 30S ribosomal protein S12 methylthiotransferase RimO [Rhodocyclaceae bacterium]